ncbi:hypothetical protein [Streptomyces naphthomycinicus]|uniref:hypothetical protein n=1 Tax=Streptomyces naphthomycinicus TaxID=2872625 RepID=UPI001CEC48BE|nr:hypothetical protein [Streptomyces sp. TML10]
MITVRFTVRPGQGTAGGFDPGGMTVTGDHGTIGLVVRRTENGVPVAGKDGVVARPAGNSYNSPGFRPAEVICAAFCSGVGALALNSQAADSQAAG